MSIVPSGNRRNMESQQYFYNEDASSSIKKMFEKIADTLDLNREEEFGDFSPNQNKPIDTDPVVDNQFETDRLQEAMNNSSTLPQSQNQPLAKGGFEDKVNGVVQKILQGLEFDPEQWEVNTNTTSEKGAITRIQIVMTREAPEAGPVIQHS